MSDINMARRTAIQAFFAGTDITPSLQKYLLSMTYTDNEEDETDDLQFKLHDREGIWVEKWLNTAIQAAAEGSAQKKVEEEKNAEPVIAGYKVTAQGGLAVRSRAGDQYYQYGTLAYGTVITVDSISGGWANFTYSGKNAYCNSTYLQAIYSGGSSGSSSVSSRGSGSWAIGDDVIATGRPQYTSYGEGTPGAMVTNYKGKITHLNLKSGVSYPICVGYLGWFSESQVQKVGATSSPPSEGKADKGLRIQAVIVRQNWNGDGKDDTLECGQFELDSVVAQGPPNTVTIKATSLPYSSTVRQTAKSKSWENYTLSGIGNEIASKNGMTCMFLSSANPSYSRVEQYKTSDIAFLQKLCHDAGCSLKVSNNIIVIFDQATYEKKSEVLTIKRGSGYTKYKLSTGENDTYTSCRVSYTTPSGSVISATAYIEDYDEKKENNQCLNIYQKVSSISEAKQLAEKMLRLHNKYELQAVFTFPGNPKLLAGCTVKLEGWGAWSGKYIIKQAKHKVDNSGYTTQITLRIALAANVSSSGSDSGNSSGTEFSEGDRVMCNAGVTTYYNGVHMVKWVPTAVLYVRKIEQGGKVLLVSTEPTKPVYTGRVWAKDVHKI